MIVRNGKQQGGGWWRESVMEALLDLPSGDGLRSDRKRSNHMPGVGRDYITSRYYGVHCF